MHVIPSVFGRARMFAALCALAVVATATPAAAKPGKARVVIEEFTGPKRLAKQARLEVIRALKRRYALIPVARLAKAKAKRGDDYAALAKALEADAIVTGSVRKKGRRFEIAIAVRAGDGEVAGEAEATARRARLSKPESKKLAAAVGAAMDAFDERRAERLAKAERKAEAAAERERANKRPARRDDEAGSRSAGVVVETRTTTTTTTTTPWLRGSVFAGGMFASRTLGYDVSGDIPGAMEPFEYGAGIAPGIDLAGELYPLGSYGTVKNLGLRFAFARSLGHNSELRDERFPTVQTYASVGLQWLQQFGSGRNRFGVFAVLGWERLSHAIDTGGVALALPDVTYDALAAGGGVRVPIGEALTVDAGGRYLLGLSAGDIADADNFGGGAISGFTGEAGVTWRKLAPIHLRGGLRFTQMGIGFDGDGALSELDMDADPEVVRSTDRFFGFNVTAGFAFF